MCDDYSKIQNKTNAVCSLLARAIVCKFANTIQHQVNNLFSDGVVSACKVVGSIFFSTNQLLRMEQLAVRTSANFINHLVSRTHRERSLSFNANMENMDTRCALNQKPPTTTTTTTTTTDPKEHRLTQTKK